MYPFDNSLTTQSFSYIYNKNTFPLLLIVGSTAVYVKELHLFHLEKSEDMTFANVTELFIIKDNFVLIFLF